MYPLSEVRKQIELLGVELGKELGHGKGLVYVDEKYHNNQGQGSVDRLLRKVRGCRVFLSVIWNDNPGTPIDVETVPKVKSAVSYWEIELYQSTICAARPYVFVRKDLCLGNPNPRLRETLSLLALVKPRGEWVECDNEDDLVRKIAVILRQEYNDYSEKRTDETPSFPRWEMQRQLVTGLDLLRCEKISGSSLPVTFPFPDDDESERRTPDMAVVESILARHVSQNRKLNSEQVIGRLWMVLHELCLVRLDTADTDVLKAWNCLLPQWNGSASWYGLHGHVHFGCLSALNTLKQVRQRLRRALHSSDRELDPRSVYGPLASEHYSFGKLLRGRRDRLAHFRDALGLLKTAIPRNTDLLDEANMLAVRASVKAQLLFEGAYWDGRSALADFRSVLAKRCKAHAGSVDIGRAMVDLGYAELRIALAFAEIPRTRLVLALSPGIGEWSGARVAREDALKRMLDGLSEIEKSEASTEFLPRALKHLGQANRLLGREDEARAYEDRAMRIAERQASRDQAMQVVAQRESPDRRNVQ